MQRYVKALRKFFTSEDGATATEYAVMIALIIIVAISAVAVLGQKVSNVFVDTESTWNSL